MPQLNVSQALTANQLGFNPFSGWQYEYLPWPARVLLLARGTHAASKVNLTVYSGSETIQERSPMQNGGVAGTTPSELNTAPIAWNAAAGDRLKALIDETAGATPTVDLLLIVNPLY